MATVFGKGSLVLVMLSVLAAAPAPRPARGAEPGGVPPVTEVPPAARERLALAPFYKQYVDVRGFPVVASERVSPYALREAAYLIGRMLEGRQDVFDALARNKVRFTVMAAGELTTNVPEHSDLRPRDFWDRRARGLGATPIRPSVSCGEENLLCLKGDPYSAENILIHEFAHAVDIMGLRSVDPKFEGRLREVYEAAMKQGLWKGKYAANNKEEYWAEGVQSYFDTNRPPDHDHNDVDTREELRAYDPALAALIKGVFGEPAWRYVRPDRRPDLGHLAGFRPEAAPAFSWPERLKKPAADAPDPDQ